MQTGNSVIIHNSPIIQQGLKSILLSRNIGISDVMNTLPECSILHDWKDILLLIDIQYSDELKKHFKALKKNGNIIIGIDNTGLPNDLASNFDDILNIYDNTRNNKRTHQTRNASERGSKTSSPPRSNFCFYE